MLIYFASHGGTFLLDLYVFDVIPYAVSTFEMGGDRAPEVDDRVVVSPFFLMVLFFEGCDECGFAEGDHGGFKEFKKEVIHLSSGGVSEHGDEIHSNGMIIFLVGYWEGKSIDFVFGGGGGP